MKHNFVAKHNKHRASTHTDKKKHLKTVGNYEVYECPSCEGEGIDFDYDGYVFRCQTCFGKGTVEELI